jgi:hypothetical protein
MENNIQEKAIVKNYSLVSYQIKDIAWTFAFTLAAAAAPAIFAHTPANQWITGTIVNAILFLAVWRTGIANSLLVAALPSSIALVRGLLPAPMAVLIPYIILSNIILIAVFYTTKKHPLSGVFLASSAKFLFLFALTSYFLKIDTPLLAMMHWPQLATALAGGLVAIGAIHFLPSDIRK